MTPYDVIIRVLKALETEDLLKKKPLKASMALPDSLTMQTTSTAPIIRVTANTPREAIETVRASIPATRSIKLTATRSLSDNSTFEVNA